MRSQTQSIAMAAAAFAALAKGNPMQSFNDLPLDAMLVKRTVTDITCGLWPTADLTDNGKNYNNLGDKGDELVTVEAGGCNRIGTSFLSICCSGSALTSRRLLQYFVRPTIRSPVVKRAFVC